MKTLLFLLGPVLLAPALAQPALSRQECARIFQSADACKSIQRVDSAWVAEAWDSGHEPGEAKFLGHVLRQAMVFEGDSMSLLIGLDAEGKIVKVLADGSIAVAEEFLVQFQGRSRSDSLMLAEHVEDLLYVPARIKPMRGRLELSAAIIQKIKAALQVVPPLLN